MRQKTSFLIAVILILSGIFLIFLPEVLAFLIITGIAIVFVFKRSSSNEEI